MSRTDSLWTNSTKITILSAAIKYWMHKYYDGNPVIEDGTFDIFYRELERLEKVEGHVRHDSPTKTAGGLIR